VKVISALHFINIAILIQLWVLSGVLHFILNFNYVVISR